jgi:hypothetical protein
MLTTPEKAALTDAINELDNIDDLLALIGVIGKRVHELHARDIDKIKPNALVWFERSRERTDDRLYVISVIAPLIEKLIQQTADSIDKHVVDLARAGWDKGEDTGAVELTPEMVIRQVITTLEVLAKDPPQTKPLTTHWSFPLRRR